MGLFKHALRAAPAALLLAALGGCGGAEVLVWHTKETFPPNRDFPAQLLTSQEWSWYRQDHPEIAAGHQAIASLRADDAESLLDLAEDLGGHFVVDFQPLAYAVERRTRTVTRFFYGRTFDFKTLQDVRGKVVRLGTPNPPRPRTQPAPGLTGVAEPPGSPIPLGSLD